MVMVIPSRTYILSQQTYSPDFVYVFNFHIKFSKVNILIACIQHLAARCVSYHKSHKVMQALKCNTSIRPTSHAVDTV